MEGLSLAKICALAALEVQAEDVRIWDLRGVSSLTDFMVVCSGTSQPHLRAILRDVSDHVEKEAGERPVYVDGRPDTRWVVLDYIHVMVHIMHEEAREFYGLEKLWADAKEIVLEA